ncbi:MAG: TonB-dependent receptor plug domain-containing protein, partial [Altererythrobacter sp.]|nr:TonB-dependent receptor plug domain-containing protein [Altererythrobacter sp.]
MRNFKVTLASGIALGVLVTANPAIAQDAGDSTEAAEESNVIIVTARRQSETLAEVPTAITVFTADALQKTGIQKADEFVQLNPGVSIVTGTAEAGDTQIN